MAWENVESRTREVDVGDVLVQEARSAFMSRVYGWMFAGLSVTGVVALLTASTPALFQLVMGVRPVLFIAQIGVVLGLSWMAPRLSGPVAAALFLAYSVLMGLTLSVIFFAFPPSTIGSAFLMTAGTFGAMSAYGTLTKKDLSAWGTFLIMGLIGIVIASVVSLFVHNSMLSFVIACASILVFSGLTAWDTQKLRQMYAGHGYNSAASLSIVGALTLYLDFINLFLAMLRLMSRRR
jgi:FtsH-binding integral membrane protein